MGIQLNQIVGRKSYKCDIPFRVIRIYKLNGKPYCLLYGEDIRLIADAPLDDLVVLDHQRRNELLAPYQELVEQSNYLFRQDHQFLKEKKEYEATAGSLPDFQLFQLPGRVLHIDGDPNYLKKCLALYKKLGVPVFGIYCDEKDMPDQVPVWVDQFRPDILVITGHDSYSKQKENQLKLKLIVIQKILHEL